MRFAWFLGLLLLGATACKRQSSEPPPNAAPGPGAEVPFGAGSAGALAPQNAPAGAPGPASAPAPGAARGTLMTPEQSAAEPHGPPLPELSVKSFGLHIGGSPADAAARDEFLRALESAEPRYLDCYRLLETPGSAGTFGADLTLGGAGGLARASKARTRLGGAAFASCMLRAFESVKFAPPPSGRSVVVSYSVKFDLKR
jgi:hypothetical protein